MTNEEIKKRIPEIKKYVEQIRSDFNQKKISEEEYHLQNKWLSDEIGVLTEIVEDNIRQEKFDKMMGEPIKIISEWFGCKRS